MEGSDNDPDKLARELLDDHEMMQEARSGRSARIGSRICQEGVLDQLLSYALGFNPDCEGEEAKTLRTYSGLSAECLSYDVAPMIDQLMQQSRLTKKLFSFLNRRNIPPFIAFFFTQCIHRLYLQHPQELSQFLVDQQEDADGIRIVDCLVNHVDTPHLNELLLALIGGALTEQDTAKLSRRFADWWVQQGLFEKLLDRCRPEEDEDTHVSVCRLLLEIVQRWQFPYLLPYVRKLVARDTLEDVLRIILAAERLDGCSVIFQEGMSFANTVVGNIENIYKFTEKCNGSDDSCTYDRADVYLVLVEHLDDFITILDTPGPLPPVPVTWGTSQLDPPLGPNRMKVAELVLSMVRSNPSVEPPLIEKGFFSRFLALFEHYDMNNMFAALIDELLWISLQPTRLELRRHLIGECKLHEVLVRCNNANKQQLASRGHRKGHMGFVTKMALQLVEPSCEVLAEMLKSSEMWKDFERDVLPGLQESITLAYTLSGNNVAKTNLEKGLTTTVTSYDEAPPQEEEQVNAQTTPESKYLVNKCFTDYGLDTDNIQQHDDPQLDPGFQGVAFGEELQGMMGNEARNPGEDWTSWGQDFAQFDEATAPHAPMHQSALSTPPDGPVDSADQDFEELSLPAAQRHTDPKEGMEDTNATGEGKDAKSDAKDEGKDEEAEKSEAKKPDKSEFNSFLFWRIGYP